MATSNAPDRSDEYAPEFAEILNTYSRVVSIVQKGKSLDKFGYNASLDIADGAVVVSGLGTNETLQTTNAITHVTAGSGDTHTVTVEGHYLDADGNLVFKVQTATLNGTSNVALSQPLARASRAVVKAGGIPTGPINVRIGSGGTSVLLISAGDVQSEKCQTSLSYRDFWIIEDFGGAVLGSNNADVTFQLQIRTLFDTDGTTALTNPNWRPIARRWVLGNQGRAEFSNDSGIIVPPNTDIRIVASTTANTTKVTAHIKGHLAVVVDYADAADPAAA